MMSSRYSLFFACLAILSPVARAQPEIPLETVLRRYVDAMGGSGNLRAIQSISMRGSMADGSGETATIQILKTRPNLSRMLFIRSDGLRLTLGYDGTTAWQQAEFGGQTTVRAMNPDEARQYIVNAPIENCLVRPDHFGATLDYEGVVPLANGVETHCIVAKLPGDTRITYYLDPETHVERQITTTIVVNGTTLTTHSFPSDYRYINGVPFAFRIVERSPNGMRTEITIDTVSLNVGALKTLFAMPELSVLE